MTLDVYPSSAVIWEHSLSSTVHEVLCRIDDFDILNGELVNRSF